MRLSNKMGNPIHKHPESLIKTNSLSKRIRLIFYSACVILITFWQLRPYSLHITDSVVNAIDPLFYAWNLNHNAKVLTDENINAYDTNIFYPLNNTIAYSDTLWAQSIIATPIIWASKNPILAVNLITILSFPLAAISMYLLAKYLTGNELAAMITGILYSFSYPRIAQIEHLPILNSQWLPLVIYYTLRFANEGKFTTLLSACLFYLISMASSIYFALLLIPSFVIIMISYCLKWFYEANYAILLHRLKLVLIAVLPFVTATVLINIPYLRLYAEYPEYKRTLFDIYYLRALPVDFISVTPQSLLHVIGWPASTAEHNLYPTAIILITATFGAYTLWKKSNIFFFIFVISGFISLILALGTEQHVWGYKITLPYYYLFNALSLFQTIRVPARFGIIVILNLTVLSAFALNKFINGKCVFWKSILVTAAFFIEIWQISTPYVPVPAGRQIPPVYLWLKNEPYDKIIAELPLTLFYKGNTMDAQKMKKYHELQQSDNYALETYRIYFSTIHGNKMINGYSGFFPAAYNELTSNTQSFPSEKALKALKKSGVTLLIVNMHQFETGATSLIANMRQFETDVELIKKTLSLRTDLKLKGIFDGSYVYEFIN